MDFVIHWFWVVKYTILLSGVFVGFKVYSNRNNPKTAKRWAILGGILVILAIITPVKLETNTRSMQQTSNYQIQETKKELPSKIEDNSYDKRKTTGLELKTKQIMEN